MLPFDEEVFFSSIGSYNAATWPALPAGWLLCLTALGLTFRPTAATGRISAGLLAVSWAWIGVVFLQIHLGGLFFAAPLLAALFVAQAILLAWSGVVRTKVSFRFESGPIGGAGLGLVLFALLGWPLVDWASHADWSSVRVAGTAPSPTAIFTLGILLLAERRTPVRLALAPLAWCLIGGAAAWVLGLPEAISLPLAGLVAFVLILWKNRRADRLAPPT